MEWQELSSAPTDTEILLFFPAWKRVLFGYRKVDDIYVDEDGDEFEKPPSHWMPLPGPPTALVPDSAARQPATSGT